MDQNKSDRENRSVANGLQQQREPYVTPELIEYGHVEELTRSANASNTDLATQHA